MKIKNKIFYIIAFVAMFWTSITQAYLLIPKSIRTLCKIPTIQYNIKKTK